ncbi:MAG: DUF4416 family protein [Candidatus Aminicenantes bacterium]|nr:DUF4416 family protein [Candidatus Aminicenantes bacterium]
MAEAKPFIPVKYISGIIFSRPDILAEAEARLVDRLGAIDLRSPEFAFALTDYYEKQMGEGLSRVFLSFEELGPPERLSAVKLQTNAWEEEIRVKAGASLRIVNIDPGYLTASALFMATAKDFAHRVALRDGIYAHLELLFTRTGVRYLDWTYPDFRQEGPAEFFRMVRTSYLAQLIANRDRLG